MPIVDMDSTFIATATCPPGKKRIDYYSGAHPGLLLECRATGQGTFYQRYRDENGRLKAFKIGSPADLTWDKVKKVAAKVRARAAVGEDPVEAKREKRAVPLYGSLAERYLAHTATYQRSPETTAQYMRKHITPRWGRTLLSDITSESVALWLADLSKQGYAPATVERARVVFSHSLKLAMRWGVPGLTTNPVVGIPRPPLNNARERYLTTDEAKRLREALERSRNKSLKHIVALLVQFGCRSGELLAAEWSHFDLERRIWRIPQSKSGKARYVPIAQGALDVIAQLPRYEGCPYLLPNPKTKKPWVGIFMSWDTARKQAGLSDLRIHDLRHTAASQMAAAGVDLYTIGKVLGHSNVKTTQRYSHLCNDTLLAAVEAGSAKMGINWSET